MSLTESQAYKTFVVLPPKETPADNEAAHAHPDVDFIYEDESCFDSLIGQKISTLLPDYTLSSDISFYGRKIRVLEKILTRISLYNSSTNYILFSSSQISQPLENFQAVNSFRALLTNIIECRYCIIIGYNVAAFLREIAFASNPESLLPAETLVQEIPPSPVSTSPLPANPEPADTQDCWSRFDGIYVICSLSHKERISNVKAELERVECPDTVEYRVDLPDPFIEKLQDSISFRKRSQRNSFRCGYNHYRAILSAYHTNKKHILLIEDDILFIKDKETLFKKISVLPDDYDLAMLDKNYNEESGKFSENTNDWRKAISFFSSGCYALSRKGMERIIYLWKRDLSTGRLKNNDNYFNNKDFAGLNFYASFPSIAIQRPYSDCNTNIKGYYSRLKAHGLVLETFDIPDLKELSIQTPKALPAPVKIQPIKSKIHTRNFFKTNFKIQRGRILRSGKIVSRLA